MNKKDQIQAEMATALPSRQKFNFRHPSVTLITGPRGSGKTVTAHSIAQEYHEDKKIDCNVICTEGLHRRWKNPPDWIKLINVQYMRIEPDKLTIWDDAQLHLHARRFMQRQNVTLDQIISLSRHRKSSLIITSQYTARIDRNIVMAADQWVNKRPKTLGTRMERSEIRKQLENVQKGYAQKNFQDPRQYSYVINDYEGWVGPTKLPKHWTIEIGDWAA